MSRSMQLLFAPWRRLRRPAATASGWLFGALLLISSGVQAVTADDYLRQLEAEAKQRAATPLATKATAAASLENIDRLPPGLQQDSFEKALRELFVGTYVFYQRLESENKDRIYDVYRQNNRVDAIRAQILKLLSGGAPER